MLKRVIGCTNSKQLWEKLHTFFKNRARAKVRKYQSELRNIKKKDTESISEYLLRIKILIDSLDFAGRSVNFQEHINVILGGLPEEYYADVTLINNKSLSTAPCSIEEIEYILLVREVWIEEKKKVQNNNESDVSDPQSLNGNIYSGQQPISSLPLTNSFLQQYPPNAALLAAAAASDSRYSPLAWTSPQYPQPPLPPSYSSISRYSQSNY
ncbi:retrovirus-related Pol polyprotein from transposon TNT 1-94 [Trifolium pratense]|uniref:Retrovirus-related Pol polyprotein from transposon TNT 1-94 n=1 Tax=Trifolium pratense TaxID=57577 RepID=A0A2K3K7I8_TRIPR|nr:retrovirus-related Pol polyprotein from transposon TNT 1-94 [Trifolium pratense]